MSPLAAMTCESTHQPCSGCLPQFDSWIRYAADVNCKSQSSPVHLNKR